eukprot:1136852-Pelagomonas_calceolata.AAC.1
MGFLNFCSIDGVSCCVKREVKARKLADAMTSRTCPGMWMREPLVYSLLLKAQGEQVNRSASKQ